MPKYKITIEYTVEIKNLEAAAAKAERLALWGSASASELHPTTTVTEITAVETTLYRQDITCKPNPDIQKRLNYVESIIKRLEAQLHNR